MVPRSTTTTDTLLQDRVEHTAAPHHQQAIRRQGNINLLHSISLQRSIKVQEDTVLNHRVRACTALLQHHKVNMAKLHNSIALHNTVQHQHREDMDTPHLHMTNTASMAPPSQDPTIPPRPHNNTANSPLLVHLANRDINKVHQVATANRLQASIHLCLAKANMDSLRLVDSTDSHHKASTAVASMDSLHMVASMVVSSNSTSSRMVVDTQVSRRVISTTKDRDLPLLDGRCLN